MIQTLKERVYFLVAWYFRFFAEIRLKMWNPRIIVVTGSSGKTTLLHLIESQLGSLAKYSHNANSAIGIPFDILGLSRKTFTPDEWLVLFLKAPFMLLSKIPSEKIYVVEVDCDRPYEGKFLSTLLKPEVTMWVSLSKTHSINFEHLLKSGKFKTVEEAISQEFGNLCETTKKLVVIDSANEYQENEAKRTKASLFKIDLEKKLKKYDVNVRGTLFVIDNLSVSLSFLLPRPTALSVLMCKKLTEYLNIKFDQDFKKLQLPPGRSSVFKGIKDITIVDSTYNANLDSMKAILEMYSKIDAKNKWIVLADMLEQGDFEKEEHEKLADVINKYSFEKIILMGPRVKKYTLPKLKIRAKTFLYPNEVLDFLDNNIKGNETILFKGARFLEGVVEKLLADKEDAKNLVRREKVWQIRREKWGL